MTDGLTIRAMTRDDVDFAVRLANKEGWNPGLSDAECFYAADPGGFFIAELGGRPVGTMSAVRYEGGFGFVGLYIMIPEARGKGYGMRLWNHAIERLEDGVVGLDAVVEQEATYLRSGFKTSYRSRRYRGMGGGERPEEAINLERVDFKDVLYYDRRCFPDTRTEFLRLWLDAAGAKGYGVVRGDRLAGYGVVRPCVTGYKMGPLFADDGETAEIIYQALRASVNGELFYLDVIEPNEAAMELAARHKLEQVFTTVRMYRGDEPAMRKDRVFGVTSFELG